jgi:hypothetical protein
MEKTGLLLKLDNELKKLFKEKCDKNYQKMTHRIIQLILEDLKK